MLSCGVSQGLPGFSSPDDKGNWTGLDVDVCRAIAAAILGSPDKAKFIPLSWAQQKLTVAEENLQGFVPDAALVRISTQGLDEAAAMRTIDQFTRAMIAAVPPPLRRVFVG